ncbi:MAG: hypothetical protein N2V74_02785 [Candidatus Methanospirare jalkutatii]|nr:hypothetical protein [Candidatus Methanospirare jalkutatii]UYZ40637.1 MAG: hypothetical protein N2V74_02785 [Candidatus Methanospirare jalkutatii]
MEVRSVKREGFENVRVTLRNSEEPDRKGELEMVVDMAMYSLLRHMKI